MLPVAHQNRNLRPIVFKSASANPRQSLFGKANAKPAARSPARRLAVPELGLPLGKRHWSVDPKEEWVVHPEDATSPRAWPQNILYWGVYFVGTLAALVAVGGWRGARSLYQNSGQIRQECTMAVVTGYSSAKRRLVTLRRRTIPAQPVWRRQNHLFFWQRSPRQGDAMEDVSLTDEVFVTPPTTRYSTPEEHLNEGGPSTPPMSRPRTDWASDRGFQMG